MAPDPLRARRRLLNRRRGRSLSRTLAIGAGWGAAIVVCGWLLLSGVGIFGLPGA